MSFVWQEVYTFLKIFVPFFLGVFLEGQRRLVVFISEISSQKNKKVLRKFWTPHVRSHTHVVVVVVVVGEQVVLVSSVVFTNSF